MKPVAGLSRVFPAGEDERNRVAPGPDFDRLGRIEQLLVKILERVSTAHGARDQADERLLVAIYDTVEGFPFKASHVVARARHVPALAAALQAADITSQEQLGKLFGRLEGVTIAGLRLERTRDRKGPWRIVAVQGVLG